MEALVKMVTERAGISEDQARKAIQAVRDFLGDKLPGPVAGQVDAYLSGEGGGAEGAAGDMAEKGEGLLDKAKGLFGRD